MARTNGQLVTLTSDVLGSGGSNETGAEKENLLAGTLVLLDTGADASESGTEVLALVEHSTRKLGEDKGGAVDLVVVVLAIGHLAEGVDMDRPASLEQMTNPIWPEG